MLIVSTPSPTISPYQDPVQNGQMVMDILSPCQSNNEIMAGINIIGGEVVLLFGKELENREDVIYYCLKLGWLGLNMVLIYSEVRSN